MTGEGATSISKLNVLMNPIPSGSSLDETDVSVPTVGNLKVYTMIGDFDRPMVTNNNSLRPVYTLPLTPPNLATASGVNPVQIDASCIVRNGIAIRGLKTERYTHETPTYVFGDVSVDPSVVQNAGQYDPPYSLGRDLLTYRTSFTDGGNIIWPLGSSNRNGISSRVMNRNIVNLCK